MGSKIVKILFSLIFIFFVLSGLDVFSADNVVRVGLTDNKFQNVLKQTITIYGTSECEICDKHSRRAIFKVPAETDILVTNSQTGLQVCINGNQVLLRDFVVICPQGVLGVRGLLRKGTQALYHGAFEVVQNQNNVKSNINNKPNNQNRNEANGNTNNKQNGNNFKLKFFIYK